MKEDKLIKDWLNHELSPEEKELMEKTIAFTENLDTPKGREKEDAWQTILSRVQTESKENEQIIVPQTQKRNFKWQWTAVAAAVLIIAYFGFFNQAKLITKRAAAGELLSVTLPDNSKITLNSGTEITYRERGFTNNREVSLNGEAFFEVTPGPPFRVANENSTVTVLGTSFNVYNRSNDLKVSVFEGKVEVALSEQSVLLTHGEESQFVKGKLTKHLFNEEETATWRDGSFYYEGEPLKRVIEELERQFNIQIIVNTDIKERFYSGYFSKANQTEALQLVFVPMGLSIHTNGSQITIE
ncbi:FecR family protein [Roseivirga sp.]|uniref:FecR family protein n=1 Tax=Roseivirga sp. TaxID=1964215 RepID=UPI003B52855F